MLTLLERFRRKKWEKGNAPGPMTISRVFDQTHPASLIDRRIHLDLDSLVAQDNANTQFHHSLADQTQEKTQDIDRFELDQNFLPLRPSLRRRSIDTGFRPTHLFHHEINASKELDTLDISSDSERKTAQEEARSIKPSLSLSTVSTDGQDTSGGTFGSLPQKKVPSRKASAAPTTPSLQHAKGDVQSGSWRSTPESGLDHSPREYDPERIASSRSRNTTGIPSPASSGHTFGSHCKHQISAEKIPPMPPLDHPAFLSTISKITSHRSHHDTVHDFPASLSNNELARNAHSLPSISHGRQNSLSKYIRKRARTYSKSKVVQTFSETHCTPNLESTPRRFQHRRSQSHSSSRRASAEFSAIQAFYTRESKISGSWEVDVSREMVRMSLEEKHALAGNQQIAGDTAKIGKTRGDSVRDYKSSILSLVFYSLPTPPDHFSPSSLHSYMVWTR